MLKGLSQDYDRKDDIKLSLFVCSLVATRTSKFVSFTLSVVNAEA